MLQVAEQCTEEEIFHAGLLKTCARLRWRKQQLLLLGSKRPSELKLTDILESWSILFDIEADFFLLWRCSTPGRSGIRGTR